MQSQSHARDSSHLPDDGHAPTTTLTKSEHDSYYSNHEIAVLHSIVAAAQHELDHAPDTKPLPAAVLFKAYDEILPNFGIDPDSDDHLSAFVFRIGGEQSHGTLFDKFQAILDRMGIVLEFGDDTPILAQSSPSSPSPAQLRSSRLGVGYGQRITTCNPPCSNIPYDSNASVATDEVAWSHAGDSSLHRGSQVQSHDVDATHIDPAVPFVSLYDDPTTVQHRGDQPNPRKDVEAPPLASRQTALVHALDIWRNLAAIESRRVRSERGQEQKAEAGSRDGEHQDLRVMVTNPKNQANPEPTAMVKRLHPALHEQHALGSSSSKPNMSRPQARQLPHTSAGAKVRGTANASSQSGRCFSSDIPGTSDVVWCSAQQERMLHRAARARQIYLASKYFNRWADRTALRLEREAVARRHMIRFRCFRGWSEVPSSKLPAAENLRAATAVQKLRRAVIHQEEQLSLAASAIARTHLVDLTRRVFGQWACRVVEHAFHHGLTRRNSLKIVRKWKRLAWDNTESKSAALAHTACCGITEVVDRWTWKARQGKRQLAAAQQVETVRLFFAHLGEWLDQTELKRRSLACERDLHLEQTRLAFDAWNLLARAQAFRWKCEYSTVTSALGAWLEITAHHHHSGSAAQRQYQLMSMSKVGRQVKQLGRRRANLASLQERARLYIGGTLLLEMFSAAVQERRTRMKGSIRRYLMLRYTQVSSKRRRRTFMAALDHWNVAAAESLNAAHAAKELRSSSAAERRHLTLANWGLQAAVQEQAHIVAHNHCKEAWLRLWDERSGRQNHRHAQAWRIWTLEQERLCFKAWSIATLQKSGQAHTATVARQRHSRESRGRVLQRWRASSRASRRGTLGQNLTFTEGHKSHVGSRNRSAGRGLTGKLWSSKQPGHVALPMETPTRWTGMPVPMTNALPSRLMAIAGEAGGDPDAATSSLGGAQIKEPRHGRLANSTSTAPTWPSTTPLALLPAQFERKLPVPRSRAGNPGSSELGRSLHARPDLQPGSPWHTLVKSTGAVNSSLGGVYLNFGPRPSVSATEPQGTGRRLHSQSMSVTSGAGRPTAGLRGPVPRSTVSRPPASSQVRVTSP